MSAWGQVLSQIKSGRILIKDRDGKRSIFAHYADFCNAIMQTRQIAFDGRQWYCQPKAGRRFEPVGESEVPEITRQTFEEYRKRRHS